MVNSRRGILSKLLVLIAAAGLLARAAESSGGLDSTPSAEVASAEGMQWCRVQGEQVNIRATPDTVNLPVTTLRNGAYVRAKSAQSNWMEIEWPSHVPAWVLKDTIEVSAADSKSGAVRTARARIMSQGMTNSPEVAMLARGEKVSIVALKGDWYQVQAPAAARAYINAKYVVASDPPSETKRDDVCEIVILQEEARWPKSIPAVHVKAKKPVIEEARQLAEVVDLEKLSKEKKVAEEKAQAERKKIEAEAAPVSKTLVLKNDRPIILHESDFKEPTESDYTGIAPVAEAAPVPEPTPTAAAASAAPKVVAGPAVIEVNDANFDSEVANFKGPVLIDFHATWCGPCRMAGPIVDEVAEEFRGRVKVAKIDVDQAPNVARRFGISSIPCLILFNDGKTERRASGVPGREMLKGWVRGK